MQAWLSQISGIQYRRLGDRKWNAIATYASTTQERATSVRPTERQRESNGLRQLDTAAITLTMAPRVASSAASCTSRTKGTAAVVRIHNDSPENMISIATRKSTNSNDATAA